MIENASSRELIRKVKQPQKADPGHRKVMALSTLVRGTNTLNTLKSLLRLFRVLLDLQKCILSGAINVLSVRSSQGNSSLFEITRASVLFSRTFQIQFNVFRDVASFPQIRTCVLQKWAGFFKDFLLHVKAICRVVT